ncbi:hypothetical protein [Methanobrevibacter sp.]|uniref:hypothetical protein n=1 Tax=Methanobrevibacter sp. TaxID=66852 RepID=UPI0026E0ED2D|nr:hypothetical protein [Methanobrevibacter sp.]MDO5824668.1 hypothetical protein [Methanobrevibacter sp.]
MYTYQQRLEYARKLKRLHELYVIKDNIHLTYKYKNQNKAIHNAHSLQDKIINSIIDDAVYGNANAIKNIDSTIEKLMTSTLENERKRIHHQNDKYVNRAVELNSERYTKILTNRINTEAIKLERKIESELRSGVHNGLSEAQTRKALHEKYQDTAKARIKNIIKDSVHTNESNISFINALNEGYSYKVWMNGQGKGKVRAWHRAKLIAPVPIDEYFDIYGHYHAQAMYPGDLYAGAENVANCRCWLRYTNRRPERLGQKQTVFNIPQTSYLNSSNNQRKNPFGEGVKVKPIETIKTTISHNTKNLSSKIKNVSKKIYDKIKPKNQKSKPKRKNNVKRYKRFKGITKKGMLPNKEQISDYFSKDVTKTSKFDNIIDRWANTPLDKKLRIFANCGFDYKKLEKLLLKDKNVLNYYIPMLMREAKISLQQMEKLMRNSYTKKDMVFYRQQEDLFLGNDPQIGNIIEWDSYNSVSISKEGLRYFQKKYKKQKWEFTILAPKGTRGVYISPKAGKKYAPEMEFILDRHTKLKIIDIDYVSHKVKLKVII